MCSRSGRDRNHFGKYDLQGHAQRVGGLSHMGFSGYRKKAALMNEVAGDILAILRQYLSDTRRAARS